LSCLWSQKRKMWLVYFIIRNKQWNSYFCLSNFHFRQIQGTSSLWCLQSEKNYYLKKN
jgi:hypothetical protein